MKDNENENDPQTTQPAWRIDIQTVRRNTELAMNVYSWTTGEKKDRTSGEKQPQFLFDDETRAQALKVVKSGLTALLAINDDVLKEYSNQ